MQRHSPVPADVVCNFLRRNDTNTPPPSIVVQCEKHSSSELVGDGGKAIVGKEIENVALVWVMSVKLGSDTLNIIRQDGVGTSRYGTPPLVGDCAAGENDHHAPCIVIPNLMREIDKRRMAGGGGLERTLCIYA